MSIRDLLLTHPDTIGEFWIKSTQFYTTRDIECVASSLFSSDPTTSLQNSLKRYSITRGSKLVHHNPTNPEEYEGFVDLHTITFDTEIDNSRGVFRIKLFRGSFQTTLLTRTRDTFLQWIGHLEYYTIREG